ncbi:hypothetical protein B0H67DRAFT_562363 [Lasiosphaeris hirsuta]|uniref:Mid2 domain-containing protein n=1 Tax=Lasiosphaeris hirsuta TaxID=260670 RepID=A0AA40BAL5_9PEZI|nr:hypothetical protein B0H67DRAFT_562363 [Lasiosphaeris hirsuta]
MRIPAEWTWWAAAVALSIGVANGDVVDFDGGFEGAKVASVDTTIHRVPRNSPVEGMFTWEAENVEIASVKLYAFNQTLKTYQEIGKGSRSGGNNGGQLTNPSVTTTTVTAVTTGRTIPTGIPRPPRTIRADASGALGGAEGLDLLVLSDQFRGSVRVTDLRDLANTGGNELYFEAAWPDGTGLSYSVPFAIVFEDDQGSLNFAASNQKFRDVDKPAKPEIPGSNGQSPTSTSTSVPTAGANSGSSGSGGLSTGAIAGIAVGCALVGLALIGGLIWYFWRRRQQSKDPASLAFGPSRSRTDELMAEKEANAGVDVSPHSPYSDDGTGLGGGSYDRHDTGSLHHVANGITPTAATAAAAAAIASTNSNSSHYAASSIAPLQQARDAPRSFTPYSDRGSNGGPGSPSTRAGSLAHADRSGMESPGPGRSTPHGVAQQYAHLVEEGMTPEEIQRLEEEERQLDAAIEQAGQVRRPAAAP